MLAERCKDSITKINQTEVDIHLDKIDNDSFRIVANFVKSCSAENNNNNTDAVKRERTEEPLSPNKKQHIENESTPISPSTASS